MKTAYSVRSLTAQVCEQVLEHGVSLSAILPQQQNRVAEKDRALLQELCFGVVRYFPVLDLMLKQLMKKPFVGKQRILHYVLLSGIYQLHYMRIPSHAAVNESVAAAEILQKGALKNVINGVLRQFLRQQEQLTHYVEQHYHDALHPSWLIQRIKNAYPEQWQSILDANNQKAPVWLRVNRLHHSVPSYLACLTEHNISAETTELSPVALHLTSHVPITQLPGFAEGWFSVQDAAAQGAALLLDPQNEETILDLCAAPGGKTTHILELAPNAHVFAVDNDKQRIKRIDENLTRLNMTAKVIVGDALSPSIWTENQLFDRILIDVPCSATGVIRRHPDIKWLKTANDIEQLVKTQTEILNAIWPYLKPGGCLVYSTCSILPEENTEQIEQFLQSHPDASCTEPMQQLLPAIGGGDGFFYAKLYKSSSFKE